MKYDKITLSIIAVLCMTACGDNSKKDNYCKKYDDINQVITSYSYLNYSNEEHWIKPLQEINIPKQTTEGIAINDSINVYFRYSESINDYVVTCRFIPFEKDSEAGYLIANFKCSNSTFNYVCEKYSNRHTLEIMDWKNNDVFLFNYIKPTFLDEFKKYNNHSPLGKYTPFHFFDIDFDGDKELLVNDFYNGQQGNNYEVYKINQDKLIPLHYQLPFSMIDNMTKIDSIRKTITIFAHSGASYSVDFTFSQKKDSTKHIEYLPKFQDSYTESVMQEHLLTPNEFIVDSISERLYDISHEYRRSGVELKLVNQKVPSQ